MNNRQSVFKIFALLIVICICLTAVSGCGKKNNNSSTSLDEEIIGEVIIGDDSDQTDTEGNSNDNDASGDNSNSNNDKINTGSIDISKLRGQKVTMMMWRELNVSEKNVLKNFENSTGINVKYTVVNQKEYLTKVAAEIAGGTGLDICAIQSGGMSILSKDPYASAYPVGVLATMQPFFEVTGQNPKDSIWSKSWMDPYKIKDKYYGVAISGGWHTLSTVVYYNKDLFEENGITTPRELWQAGNWNWDTFKKAALEISAIDDYYYGYAGRDTYAYMLSAGCDYVGFDGKKFTNTSNDPKVKKAWEFSIEMLDSGAQFRPDGSSNYPQLFLEGKFGMYGEGSYCMANIGMMGDYAYKLNDVGFEIDAVPFPSPKGQTPVAIHRANLFGIAKNSKNPIAAGVFLRYWLDPKNAPPFSKTALNGNMKDTFDWINAETTKKNALISGGVIGYHDIDKLSGMTYNLMVNPANQINTTISSYKSFIDNCVSAANKVIK